MEEARQQQLQRDYYARTAQSYDAEHVAQFGEHDFALAWLSGLIPALGIRSILDIGAGTGRAIATLKAQHPTLSVVGIEPSPDMRAIGHGKGLSAQELTDGDAMALHLPDQSIDLVSEFGMLHHVPRPEQAVAEMLRVSRIGILISDCNNFGQGRGALRLVKQALRAAGMWRTFDWVRTRGKGYHWSEGDGIFYSYSVYDNYAQIRSACASVHVLNSGPSGINPYRSAPHVALLGLKQPLLGRN